MGQPMFLNFQLFVWLLHFIFIKCFSSSSAVSLPYTSTVRINDGFIRGILRHSAYESVPYYSYMGVPYGKSPVGDLMFKAPQPPKPWKGILNCFEFGNKCYQVERGTGIIIGTNDCLKLNVFVPAGPTNGEKYTVMVYIQGGAYMSGSSSCYGPDFLINQNVILVTFDYRLGPYGFLSLGTPEYSGNMGIKDQILALKWVQQNIGYFGGDKDKVTIFGQSAGSSSANLLLVSPAAEGLFRGAIMQSGAFLDPWAFLYAKDNLDIVLKFSSTFANITKVGPELIEYLENVDPQVLLTNTYKYFVQGAPPITITPNWYPVIEVKDAIDPIITKSPEQYYFDGKTSNVTSMFGVNTDESLYFIPVYLKDPSLVEPLNTNFEIELTYTFLSYSYKSERYKKAAQQIKTFYFGDKRIDNSTMRQLSYLFSDDWFLYGSRKCALLQSHRAPGKTFFYINNMVTRLNLFRQFSGAPATIPGATHGDELFYLFKITGPLFYHPIENIYGSLAKDSLEVQLIGTISSTWANFAKNLNPRPSNSLEPTLPIGEHSFHYMQLTNAGVFLGTDPLYSRMAFWRDFYNLNKFHVKKIAYYTEP